MANPIITTRKSRLENTSKVAARRSPYSLEKIPSAPSARTRSNTRQGEDRALWGVVSVLTRRGSGTNPVVVKGLGVRLRRQGDSDSKRSYTSDVGPSSVRTAVV